MVALSALAGEGPTSLIQAGGWFLEKAWIIPALPAISFVLILFFGKRMKYKGAEFGIVSIAVAFIFAICCVGQWLDNSTMQIATAKQEYYDEEKHSDEAGKIKLLMKVPEHLLASMDLHPVKRLPYLRLLKKRWLQFRRYQARNREYLVEAAEKFQVGIMVDGLSVMMLFVETAISHLVHIYSTEYDAGDRRYTHYFAFLSLFSASMLFFVLSENILQTIVGWELVGVCSFALIGHWWEEKPNSDAALKAFLTNRVGDMGLLVGMIVLFWSAGSWSIVDINNAAINNEIGQSTLLIASLCLTAAVMSKSGQFILHTWLPDAMAGPTPVSALIHAATMVVAGIYMVARLYGVFFEGFDIAGSSFNVLALVGSVTLVGAGLLAFVQDDIKKVLAYSTVSQLGYMVMALGVGAWTAAVFHLFTHAFFKAGLFLGAGSVSPLCIVSI